MISQGLMAELLHTVDYVDMVSRPSTRFIKWHGATKEGNVAEGHINIHELSFKAKRWALEEDKNGHFFILEIIVHSDKTTVVVKNGMSVPVTVFQDSFEPYAVFKACEWILGERNADNSKR